MRLYRCLVFPILLSLVVCCSCTKGHPVVNTALPSILGYIAREPSLSLLDSAINITGLDTAMSSGGPFTFFAPTDSAFTAAGLTLDSLRRMNSVQLLHLLEYNVIEGRMSSADVPGFLKQQFTSLHPQYNPFITKNYYGIFLNGIPVTKGDIEVGDGVVQVTSRVAIPPAGSQLDAMDREPDLHFMAALARNVRTFGILIADPNPYNVNLGTQAITTYSGAKPWYGNTLLAPTDSAFMAYGYPDTTSLINDSMEVVIGGYICPNCQNGYESALLASYIFSGFVFTSDFMGQFEVGDINNQGSGVALRGFGAKLYTSLDGMGFTGSGIAQGSPVRIIKPDIIATNGVVQKINQVFIIKQ